MAPQHRVVAVNRVTLLHTYGELEVPPLQAGLLAPVPASTCFVSLLPGCGVCIMRLCALAHGHLWLHLCGVVPHIPSPPRLRLWLHL